MGQILGSILGGIDSILGQASGALGQVISLGNTVLDFVVSILELLKCEPEPECAGVESYNFLEGPDTTEALNLAKIFDDAKGIMDSFKNIDFNFNADAFEFEFDVNNAIKNTLEGCYAGPEQCGPPSLSLYGGSGSGGLFNAVLSESGQLFGFDIVEPGNWSSAPQGKIKDKCGNGSGAVPDDIIIGDIPYPDLEGDAPRSVARIDILKQPEDIVTKSSKKDVEFKIRAKISPTDGKKAYLWYYSPDLGNNFIFIQNNNKNTLKVKPTKEKDNWYYICHVFDARDVRKKKRAKSVKSNVVRLNLTDVSSPGDDDFEDQKPRVTLELNKREIKKNNTEKAKLSWTVKGKNIRDVRVTEKRKYRKGDFNNSLYQKPKKKGGARSGSIVVCPPVETEYTIVATNAYGTARAKKTLRVEYIPLKCDISIQQSLSKPEIADGSDSARMFWNVKDKSDEDLNKFTVTNVSNPDLKGSRNVSPNQTKTFYIDAERRDNKQYGAITLGVGSTYLFPISPTSNDPFFTNEIPSACASLDTYYIARDGKDSARLKCKSNGNGMGIRSVEIYDMRRDETLFEQTFLGPSYPNEFDKNITVLPNRDTQYSFTVETNIGVSTSVVRLDTKDVRNCGSVVLGPEEPEKEPGKPKDDKDCPPGFEYNKQKKKCERKKIRDPWLPPPLFPPGIIQIPINDPGAGYDPTLPGSSGGSGRTWKAKCEVAIERVNGDWEVVGIGSEYTLFIGDTVYQPELNPITLGVPNGNERHDKNKILWENLDEEEIKKQIKGAEVFGTPYRIKDMSGFDDSRGSEIFKEVSMLDIKPIGIKGKRVKPGIYFDLTEFDDFQTPDVTFIAGARSADEKTFHTVTVPEIGKFAEDAGRVSIKDVRGGQIYGPLKSVSKIAKFGKVEVEVETDVDAPGWNGPGIYFDLLDQPEEAIEVDFTIIDSNQYTNNAITVPKNTFKDQRGVAASRTTTKKYAGGAIYGPLSTSGPGALYIGGDGPAKDYEDNTVMLASDLNGVGFFIDDPDGGEDPVLEVNEPAIMDFKFRTDDDPDDSGIAVRKIQVLNPFLGDAVMAEFDYTGEVSKDYFSDVMFLIPGIYKLKFIRPGQKQPILIREEGKQLFIRDNDGDDFNAGLWIINSRKTDTEFMRLETSTGKFVEYDKKAPQVKGTKTIKKRQVTGLGEKVESRMLLETETPQGKKYAVGTEGEFDDDDIPQNNRADVIRYYENADSSRTLVVSTGNKVNLDMVLRVEKGIFKRYDKSVRLWRYGFEYKQAKDLGFSDKDIRWHLEHVFKSGVDENTSPDNIIDEEMENKLRDSTFGPLPQNFDNVKDMSDFDPTEVGGKKSEALREIKRLRDEIKKVKQSVWKAPLLPKETRIKNLEELIRKQEKKIENAISFGYIRDYPYARSLGFTDADIRYYLTEVYLKKYPTGGIGPRMKSKLMDPTFGVFSYNPTFKINVGRPNLFDCENDYPYALSLGFGDIDIRYFLEYVYTGLVDKCMKEKLEDPNWGRPPEFYVEVTSRGCPDPCEGKTCPPGEVPKAENGVCKCIPEDDPCANKDCPDGFKCVDGECVPIPPSYPIIVTLCGIRIENPGFGYECDKDQIVVTPDKGVKIEYTCDDQGRLTEVEVIEPGIGFTEIPTITINTSTGVNAVLKPTFCFEEPEPKDPCDGVVCPEGQICVDGKCVPPCEGVVCPDGYVCENGVCVPGPCPPGYVYNTDVEKCVPSECPPGFAFSEEEGECKEIVCPEGYSYNLDLNKCIPDECPEGQVRNAQGICVDDPCLGVICPEGFVCRNGICIPDPCKDKKCPPGFECVNGRCVPKKPTIPPKTPVVRVVDCVGKIVPIDTTPPTTAPITPITPPTTAPTTPPNIDNLGKKPYTQPKKEVCD